MARVLAYIPDLLFGSQAQGALRAAGHQVELVADEQGVREAAARADVLVVDLTADAGARIELVRALDRGEARALAFYAHVETDTRARAEGAGFDLVVPRSRMAREGAELVERLTTES